MKGKSGAPASKADIAAVETRLTRDIAAVETSLKTDIARLDQKLDQNVARLDQNVARLDRNIDRLAAEVVKTQADVRDIRLTMATKDDVGRILAAIDAFAGKAVAYDQKSISHGAILTEHEDKLREHGRRLVSLETKS